MKRVHFIKVREGYTVQQILKVRDINILINQTLRKGRIKAGENGIEACKVLKINIKI